MKAIIISDHECRALLDSLKLQAMKDAGHFRGVWEKEPLDESMRAAHGTFHFIVCRWLQEMGADVVNRGAP